MNFVLITGEDMCSHTCRIALEIIRIVCAKFSSRPRSLSPTVDFHVMFRDHIFLHTFDSEYSMKLHSIVRSKSLSFSFTLRRMLHSITSHVSRIFWLYRGWSLEFEHKPRWAITPQKPLKINQKRNETKNSCVLYLEFCSDCSCSWRQFAIVAVHRDLKWFASFAYCYTQ